jgi:ABC-type oligopeptide transport system substrate-binding subunit
MRRKAISRRALCAASILAAACKRAANPYFGRTTPPNRQRLCYVLGGEPASLDPAYFFGGFESFVIPALFEGLTSYHPVTLQPMAALATHFEAVPGRSELTFYLRGHSQPRGEALPDTDNLRRQYQGGKLAQDFSRGRRAPPSSIPALWSDGCPVTAHDFVYSWRRIVDPVTAAPYASTLNAVSNAEAIQIGKLPPDSLGVKALDDFTLQIDVRPPVFNFLQLLAAPVMAAVPRRAIEAARQRGREPSWTDPERIVTSGAFTLKQRRPFDKIIVVKNSRYYEAGLVALEEIEFPTVSDGVTTANLYRAGEIDAMPGERLSALLQPVLEGRRDFHVAPACMVIWHGFNTRKPPFDNVLLRYALNMASDKAAIAGAFGGGRTAARNLVPPIEGYDAPHSLPVPIDGATYDVLAYNPEAARALLSKAGYPHGAGPGGRAFRFEMLIPSLPHSRPIAEMLQSQWRSNLNVESNLIVQEFNVWTQNVLALQYSGIAESGGWPDYLDPKGLFDWFANGSTLNGTGYDDSAFNSMLAESDLAGDPVARMHKLAECERCLLKSMPVIPIFHNVWLYLQKPFVRGLEGNALDKHPFKYAWIDTNWRPQ